MTSSKVRSSESEYGSSKSKTRVTMPLNDNDMDPIRPSRLSREAIGAAL